MEGWILTRFTRFLFSVKPIFVYGDNLKEYKFFCFNGEPKYIVVLTPLNNGGLLCDYYCLNWKKDKNKNKDIYFHNNNNKPESGNNKDKNQENLLINRKNWEINIK